jgi:hypothetical protein
MRMISGRDVDDVKMREVPSLVNERVEFTISQYWVGRI